MLIFIDLAKAFDTVDRNLLIKKLDCLGFQKSTLDWFKNYFLDRSQQVSVNGILSKNKNIEYGVIQGSTLGPILFFYIYE